MQDKLPSFDSFYELLEYAVKHGLQNQIIGINMPSTSIIKSPCSNCGWSLVDIAQHARLGCGHCYEHFKNELLPVLENAHKAVRHQGKRPKHRKVSLEDLKQKLAQAIREERYEDAGELKKLIQQRS